MLPSYDNPKSQFAISSAINNKQILRSGWINHRKTEFWFVLNNESLSWYRDDDEKDKKGSFNLNEFQVKTGREDKSLILVTSKR